MYTYYSRRFLFPYFHSVLYFQKDSVNDSYHEEKKEEKYDVTNASVKAHKNSTSMISVVLHSKSGK